MVELVGVMGDVDEWPSDMDSRVAALDFGDSMLSLAGEASLCEPSLSTADPSLSTDSLDSEQLRQRCANNKDDYKLTFADSGQWNSSNQLTTWGRIQYAQPLDEKVASAPDVTTASTSHGALRPSSLLIDFVGRHSEGAGASRLVDVNENDIREANSPLAVARTDRWRSRQLRPSSSKMKRTFADLANPPELRFLALPHQMRGLVESQSMPEAVGSDCPPSLNLSEMADLSPDSGLGCSGPVHIEDWPSLSVLLPRHVAEACSFFKRNSDLLTGSSSNCVERSSRGTVSSAEPCTTCFRVRRRFHPPVWAHSPATRLHLCDCAASEIVERGSTLIGSGENGLRSRELSVVGLPVYASARRLVEGVVEAVALSVRREGDQALSHALIALIGDGLKTPNHPWDVIHTITAPGPATKKIHSIVSELECSERSADAKVHMFVCELIEECSVECWLCYVLLKEKVLRRFYHSSSFFLSAPSAYRSLLSRLLESLQLLSVHEQQQTSQWGGACRLAPDSRVPKSSSVPARLSPLPRRQPSRIPQPRRRLTPSHSSLSQCRPPSPLQARVRADSAGQGQLSVREGERVRVLSRRGQLAHCSRLRPSPSLLTTGLIPLNNLLIL